MATHQHRTRFDFAHRSQSPLSTRSLSLPPPRPQAKAQSDDSELFYHEGTKGFTGDPNAFVYKIGLSQ